MTALDRLSVSRQMPQPPAAVFAAVTRPQRQVAIDGSGTMLLASGPEVITAVGDEFEVQMRQEPLGDYRMRNIVTVFEPDAGLEWTPTHLGHNPIGYRYGYQLARVGAEDSPITEVTAYYDWSGVSAKWRERIAFPGRAGENLARSLANLEASLRG